MFDVEDSIRYAGNYFFRQNDFEGETSLARAYTEWQYRPDQRWTINSGVYGQYFVFNERTSIEPRLGARYKVNDRQALSLGTGLHSQLQPITAYFNREEGENGEVIANNRQLDFNKSAHFVLAHDMQLGKNMRLKTELYYQYLFNVAVDKDSTSFSILNVGADFTIPNNANLVNEGTGKNYGIEITLERFLNKGFYFLGTVSLFDSKYTGSDGVERNTAFNGSYVLNVLAGKEWKVGKNNAITLDFKTTYSGGRRFSPILFDESVASREEVRDETRAFSGQYEAYFRTDIKAGFRMNGARVAQAIYFDVRNVTNHDNIFMETFNARSNRINTVYQTGFFPIFLYQIWF
jgi:hypothetical protein